MVQRTIDNFASILQDGFDKLQQFAFDNCTRPLQEHKAT
jgi:hypothetical protein